MWYYWTRCQLHLSTVVTAGDVIALRDIKHFGTKFWLLCVICVAYYVAVFPFISLALWVLHPPFFSLPLTYCFYSFALILYWYVCILQQMVVRNWKLQICYCHSVWILVILRCLREFIKNKLMNVQAVSVLPSANEFFFLSLSTVYVLSIYAFCILLSLVLVYCCIRAQPFCHVMAYDAVVYSVFFENKYELDAFTANTVNRCEPISVT